VHGAAPRDQEAGRGRERAEAREAEQPLPEAVGDEQREALAARWTEGQSIHAPQPAHFQVKGPAARN
jgi:hypothetical protein